ncbi:hypothetical protein IQ277_28085 [Nostocales cyanobacterium LEGE 12452]|nr:hypothetical protein [Nostocales cyanobacterium LEGE 12452]
MPYSDPPKWLDLNRLLESLKGKSLPEITTILFNEGRKAESYNWPGKDPASQKKADFEFVTGQLLHAFNRKEVVKLSRHLGLGASYRSLLEDLVARGEMSEGSLFNLD